MSDAIRSGVWPRGSDSGVSGRRQGRPDRHFPRGMTLLEALVVMSAITVLAGLLVPTVSKCASFARSNACSNNLRQLHSAALAYSAANEERMPPAVLFHSEGPGIKTVAWDFEQDANGDVLPGPVLERISTDGQVCQCPTFVGSATFGADPFTGYNYNTSFIGTEGSYPKTGPDGQLLDGWNNARLGLPPGALRRTDSTALFGDGGWSGGANKFMRSPMNTVEKNLGTVYAGGQDFRHDGCCNIVHLDGHCRSSNLAHKGKLATPALLKSPLGWPEHGFLSNDDRAYDPR